MRLQSYIIGIRNWKLGEGSLLTLQHESFIRFIGGCSQRIFEVAGNWEKDGIAIGSSFVEAGEVRGTGFQ
jgi:hypothetical protein